MHVKRVSHATLFIICPRDNAKCHENKCKD